MLPSPVWLIGGADVKLVHRYFPGLTRRRLRPVNCIFDRIVFRGVESFCLNRYGNWQGGTEVAIKSVQRYFPAMHRRNAVTLSFLAPAAPAKRLGNRPPKRPKLPAPYRPFALRWLGSVQDAAMKTCLQGLLQELRSFAALRNHFGYQERTRVAGCEACHGPGKEHVDGGGDKSKIFTFKDVSAQEVSARCLGCHQYGAEHANFGRSAHLQNNVGCTDCHSPHHAKESQFLMKEKQPQLCYGCHLETKQQFTRTFHHRVNEGLVKCNDCHNPHGGFLVRQARATTLRGHCLFQVPHGQSRSLCLRA